MYCTNGCVVGGWSWEMSFFEEVRSKSVCVCMATSAVPRLSWCREIHFPIQKLEFTNSGSYQAAPFLWVVIQKQLCRMVINVWKHPPHARRAASTEYHGVSRRRFPLDSSNRDAVESTSRPHTLDTLRSKTHGTWAGPSQWISPTFVIS